MEGLRNAVSIWLINRLVNRYERRNIRFDEIYNVDTYGLIDAGKQQFVGVNREQAVYYYPSSMSSMKAMFRCLTTLQFRPQQFVFMDLGCGKGKPLFFASDYPFKAIVGVEASHETAAIALKNVRTYKSPRQKCTNINIITDDVLNYEFPSEHLVIYLGNPFVPHSPMYDTLLERLKDVLIRYDKQMYIMYYCPDSHAHFDRCPFLEKITHYKSIFDSHDWAIYRRKECIDI